ncbi:hypothetical protein ABMC89_01475 [Sulfitobacter sp. HNIBRBA3233]|uniref:hypothetical protein n=1 Tax=Sulfitobacter marinivivus TaxID=3158558 RepID=UPI0032DECAD3
MSDILSPTSILIICAVSTCVLGFLFRDPLYIRVLVVIGSLFYVAYYMVAGPVPLWDAILGATLIGAASLQGAVRLLWGRLPITLPKHARHIRDAMGDIEPGLFRALMQNAERSVARSQIVLTTQYEVPSALWFVLEGDLTLRREGIAPVRITAPCFVGDIAFLSGGFASATVSVAPGAELVRWPVDKLRRSLRHRERLKLTLEALIAQDLARKLSKSTPIELRYKS